MRKAAAATNEIRRQDTRRPNERLAEVRTATDRPQRPTKQQQLHCRDPQDPRKGARQKAPRRIRGRAAKAAAERFSGRHDKQPQRARRYIMLMPTLFRNDWFDDFMDGFPTELTRTAGARDNSLMKTDVKENADTFVIDMDLPGFNKEDVKAQVKDGYLVIEAVKNADKEDKDEDGKYIRRERFYGTCKRSFYVGEQVTEEDIKAKFENGVLTLTIPKEAKKEVEAPKYIAIEG
jgi:HSP20 family molecular chaperone IbpA